MADDNHYSLPVGLIYLFNLLLGTGVLTMPSVFDQAGYISGIICLSLLCTISYVQTTFLIESMANANFIQRIKLSNGEQTNELSALLNEQQQESDCEDNDDNVLYSSWQFYQTRRRSPKSRQIHIKRTATTATATTYCNCAQQQQDYCSDCDEKGLFEKPSSGGRMKHGNDNAATVVGNETVDIDQANNQIENVFNDENETIINNVIENENLFKKFNILDKFELGNMTEMFLNGYLSKFFFISIISYLFGDLLIYNSMMSKSLRELSCTSKSYCNATGTNDPDHLDYPCWDGVNITRRNAYRLFLLLFIAILGPLTYAKIQKTKFIQIMTIVLRWLAFMSMIGITIKIFINNEAKGRTKPLNILNVPKLFGICVYSFMCHHSVPSIITPIKNKGRVYMGVIVDYVLVLTFYILIALTAVFAFDNIQQVYTLNFQIDKCSTNHSTSNPASITGFEIFLPTFPIFTLFSSYTILALTLINNMKVLIDYREEMSYGRVIRYSLPLIAIIPPLAIALFTEDVSSIVQYVGSYSGTLIQYVFPTLLVYYSRKQVQNNYLLPYIQHRLNTNRIKYTKTINLKSIYIKLNPFCSFFQHNLWIYFTAIWWLICILLVTLDHLRDAFHIY